VAGLPLWYDADAACLEGEGPMSSTKTVQCHRCHHDIDVSDVITSTVICFNCNAVVAVEQRPTSSATVTTGSGTLPSASPRTVVPVNATPNLAATVAGAPRPAATLPPPSGQGDGDPSRLAKGQTVGSYVIDGELGRGAMGIVFLGIDSILERRAALKFMAAEIARNDDCRDRFIREGRLLAKLKPHPHLVSVYSGGEYGCVPYFAMEYVDGASVKDVLQQVGRFPVGKAVDICRQAARALAFVWQELKLVHRDIKPSNLMFDASQAVVKVTDFGLAKPNAGEKTGLTQTGVILGTPDYLAPEQARCESDLDCRTDIYSLGATLFHLVAGRAPFTGKSVAEVVAAHLREEAPLLSNVVPEAPDLLVDLVARMLEKERSARPATYSDVIEALNTVGTDSDR